MNAINGAFTSVFDAVLTPFEMMGTEVALILISGLFGIAALIVFKHISSQAGIKRSKNKIKGHMIEIRLYQDDLVLVSKAICKVLIRNVQYLTFNFGPILPLLIPFAFVMAQFVVRYSFEPIPITAAGTEVLPGGGTLIKVDFAEDQGELAKGLEVRYPEGLEPISPLVRLASGKARQEIVARQAGVYDITFILADGSELTKQLVAGADTEVRWMQPERVQSTLESILWPAEAKIASDSPIERISFVYPDSDLGWLPGSGILGVMLVFLVASMAFGVAILKPLGIQI
jgi:hypothetical protein